MLKVPEVEAPEDPARRGGKLQDDSATAGFQDPVHLAQPSEEIVAGSDSREHPLDRDTPLINRVRHLSDTWVRWIAIPKVTA